MARNPELDYEFREGKTTEKPQNNPLLYGDISAGLQPRAGVQARMDPEMMASLKESNKLPLKQKLTHAAVAAALVAGSAVIFYLLHTFGIFSV